MDPELLIVGAGPGGVTAALRARSLDLAVELLDAGEGPGGQLHVMHFHPHDVPGFEAGDGAALAAVYARQLAAAGVPLRARSVARALEPLAGGAVVRLEGSEARRAQAVLIATGVRRRRLDVPGERELEGRGVSSSATRDRERFAGRRVVVVGGGDAAYENALLLAAAGSAVTLLVRGQPRSRAEFRARVAAEPRIRVRERTALVAIEGDQGVQSVRWRGPEGEVREAADGVVVKIGVVPNTEWCRGAVALDADGYVRVDAGLATSAEWVWACGDVTRPQPPSVAVAMGQATQAVAAIRARLRGA